MNKSVPTNESVDAFLAGLSEQQREDSQALIALMQNISGEAPRMWGPSIIGFGTYHYIYESGREGDIALLSFSPRKTGLTLYINHGFDALSEMLDDLGGHTVSVGCLYIKKLSDIDMTVLEKILRHTHAELTGVKAVAAPSETVDEYIDSFDEPQRLHLSTIRSTVKSIAPAVTEKISYQIASFQLNGKALLYYGGFKDHVSVYPIPKDMEKELSAYVRGRGTLWFPLDKPLPITLIKKVTRAHIARLNG